MVLFLRWNGRIGPARGLQLVALELRVRNLWGFAEVSSKADGSLNRRDNGGEMMFWEVSWIILTSSRECFSGVFFTMLEVIARCINYPPRT